MSGGYPHHPQPRSYLQELAARGELKPYDAEVTKRWLEDRERLRRIRDDATASKKDRFRAMDQLG